MADQYNVTELIPTNNRNEILARLTFSDRDMNSALTNGVTISQTIKDYWCLSIRHVILNRDTYSLHFSLHYNGTVRHSRDQLNNAGTVQWSASYRNLDTGILNQNSFTGDVDFTFGPPDVGILCSFNIGPWYVSNNILQASTHYIISVELTITFPEIIAQHNSLSNTHFNTWRSTSFKFARLLLSPGGGDVVFVARCADNSRQKLYAYKSILEGNSEYFASRLSPEWSSVSISSRTSPSDVAGTTSPFAVSSSSSSTASDVSHGQQIIYLDDPADDIDFVTLHNILYFIYIGCVNLPLPREDQIEEPFPEGYPDEADPFLLFRNADKFLLPALKERCLYNLEHGVTVENVAERLFHPACEYHEDLKEFYFNYLIANYDAVKDTEG